MYIEPFVGGGVGPIGMAPPPEPPQPANNAHAATIDAADKIDDMRDEFLVIIALLDSRPNVFKHRTPDKRPLDEKGVKNSVPMSHCLQSGAITCCAGAPLRTLGFAKRSSANNDTKNS